ncbi:hypothetical protein A2U01_0075205, partial [Trifolium medium]|nr:hypothetical protein [Trifolium medium]
GLGYIWNPTTDVFLDGFAFNLSDATFARAKRHLWKLGWIPTTDVFLEALAYNLLVATLARTR